MRTLFSEKCGGPEDLVLGFADEPLPGAGQVRVRVSACGLNYPDILMIEDRYQFTFQRPFAPGIEVAGRVEAKGAGVEGIQVGDSVVAQIDCGGLAEKALVRADQLYALPPGVDELTASSMLLTYGTAYYALRARATVTPGDVLLVLGAGGGVGIAAIQLGKLMGARVIGCVSSQAKADHARAAGADEIMLYPATMDDPRALNTAFKAACTTGFDIIFDPVGGAYAQAALRNMAWGGRYLVIGFAAGIPSLPLNLLLLKSCSAVGVFWGASVKRDPGGARDMMYELFQLVALGRLKPPPPRVYNLETAAEALAALRDRTAVGKLVVTI